MKSLFIPGFVLLCACVCAPAWGGNQSAPPSSAGKLTDKTYDVASFDGELHRLSEVLKNKPPSIELKALSESLPQSWILLTPERKYSIPTKHLRAQLDASSIEKAQEWIGHLQAEIEGSGGYGANLAAAKPELDHILARREFGAVHPPGAWEIFRQRIAAWLQRMLLKIFGALGRHPIGGEILFWLLLVGGVAFVALWVFRFLTSRDSMEALKAGSSIAVSRTWQEWIRAARQAANRGDFREAVHSAYWAGVTRLEDTGALPRDRAKTPREYLDLVTESDFTGSGGARSRQFRKEPLIALTSQLERIWYANRGAGFEDFHDSLRELEALGCPLE